MSEGSKPSFWTMLLGTFAWAAVTTFLKIVLISWYAYFAIHSFSGSGEYCSYLLIAMWALSIFGLWQALEMLERWMKRTAAKVQNREQTSPQD